MNEEEVTQLWSDYQSGLAYQAAAGMTKNIPTYVQFYEGKQWPAPTKATKNMPRPVVNIIKMICRSKESAILATPVRIKYSSHAAVDIDKFNDFADYIMKELNQERLDKEAVNDGVKKGSYFFHYYWDAEAKGKDGIKDGGLRCELIDPLNIFFSNPCEADEQKQKWVLIASREDVESVKAKADKGTDAELIHEDASESKYGEAEQEGTKYVTVLTRYFRKAGEVYCEKATKSVVINKPFAIAPDIKAARAALGIADDDETARKEDAPNNALPDKDDENLIPDTVRAPLYPIVAGVYEKKEKSIYGLSEVEGIIPNQKSINFTLAMSLLNVQELAWGKWVTHPNALREQTISNTPGQVIKDYSGTNNGIKKVEGQGLPPSVLSLVDTISSLTRVTTGSSEVMTGETLGASMSGAAIAQLQAQAQMPIDELRRTFWLAKEKQGRVLAQFFKLFYYEKEFSREKDVSEKDGDGNITKKSVTVTDSFSGEEYKDADLDVVVETVGGTRASTAGDINLLDSLFTTKQISLKTYLNAYPDDAISNKSELLKGIEEDETGVIAQLQAQVAQYEETIKQMQEQMQANAEAVNNVIRLIDENNKLRTFIAQLYGEGRRKVAEANAKIQEVTQDATDFATVIAAAGQNG